MKILQGLQTLEGLQVIDNQQFVKLDPPQYFDLKSQIKHHKSIILVEHKLNEK